MMAQVEQLPFVSPFSYTSVPVAVFADRLGDLAPSGARHASASPRGGSEEIESAVKLAKQYQTNRGFPHPFPFPVRPAGATLPVGPR